MPRATVGTGTMYCGYGAAVRWEKDGFLSGRADHDAVECVTVLYLPVFPLGAYHTCNWSENICEALPIRRTPALTLRALARPWLLGLAGFSAFVLVLFGLVLEGMALSQPGFSPESNPLIPPFLGGAGLVFVFGTVLLAMLKSRDARNRRIRLVLGRHEFGSSDPASWTEETLALAGGSGGTFVESGRRALADGRFGAAMRAARLAVAHREEGGEALTEEILEDGRVRTMLEAVWKAPWRRGELAGGEGPVPGEARCARDGRAVDPRTGALFYDGNSYCAECLDGAAGKGYAAEVRSRPLMECRVPDPWPYSLVLAVLSLSCAAAGVLLALGRGAREGSSGFVGFFMLSFFMACVFLRGRLRRVSLGGGWLRLGPFFRIPVRRIEGILYRRGWNLLPKVFVRFGRFEVSWPRGRSEEIERALRAAVALRREDSPDGPSFVSSQSGE